MLFVQYIIVKAENKNLCLNFVSDILFLKIMPEKFVPEKLCWEIYVGKIQFYKKRFSVFLFGFVIRIYHYFFDFRESGIYINIPYGADRYK